jgi:transcriptional repressor NrdR
MECPRCLCGDTEVVDTRSAQAQTKISRTKLCHVIRRRRECMNCGHRFSTIEAYYQDVFETLNMKGQWRYRNGNP